MPAQNGTCNGGALASAGAPPFFELHDAVVRRAGKPILSIDSFAMAQGEHVALLGPNGAGKSTFVNLITREVLPLHRDEPPVRFMGRDRATLAEVKQLVGIVSSSMQKQISVHLPAIDVVVGGLYGSIGVPQRVAVSDENRARALRALGMVGVADVADRDVMTLSTGQSRRVLIARALVGEPAALVLDEPCTGLDPQGMHHVRASMRRLAQAGITLVLVTHYPEDVVPEIGRIVLLKDGRVRADGAKERVLTSESMSDLFDAPLRIVRTGARGEYYSIASEY